MTAILDWFAREGHVFIIWWLLVALAGVAVLPLCLRVLGVLPDRGYTLARAVGLMMVAFAYWLLASLGFLANSTGGMALAWLLVLVISLWIYSRGERIDLRTYWRENRRVIVVTELLFVALFLGWTVYRAYQNDTWSTEKPMELAFISGIMRSDTFPPNDPWMAGYSISYYHFGYIMAAMLSMLSGIASTVGFSMMLALLFGLSGLTAFGVVYNLVRSHIIRRRADTAGGETEEERITRAIEVSEQGSSGYIPPLAAGLLAMLFLVLLGNFQLPLVELPYETKSMPADYFDYWGTQERTSQEASLVQENSPFTFTNPEGWSYWWFFRASRVLTDFELNSTLSPGAQPIDEFPQFSFLLGDVHPHVLALPFVVMCIGLAFSIVLRERDPNWTETIFYGIAIGGLIFLNTWDGPIYLVVMVGALALRRLKHNDGSLAASDWWKLVRFGFALLVTAIIAYLPFIISFRSQAAGFSPNLLYPTRFQHFFLMFGPLLLLTAALLAVEAWRGRRERRNNWMLGLQISGGILVSLVLVTALFTLLAALIPQMAGVALSSIEQNGGWSVVLPLFIQRRLQYAPLAILLLVGLALVIARLFPAARKQKDESGETVPVVTYAPSTGFVLMLVGAALMLSLIPEFFYLRDGFGTRINTIFKFYYQVWITLSIASAYGVYVVLMDSEARISVIAQYAFSALLAVVLVLGMMYPVLGIHSRAMVETGRFNAAPDALPPLSLDGSSRMPLNADPDEYSAIMCLSSLVKGDDALVVEAVRDSYRSFYARVGSITGIPTLLGWENHERQWRGSTYDEIAGTRASDITRLYEIMDWDLAFEVIEKYGIDYIMYGRTERQQYDPAGEEKFMERLDVVCEFGDTRIYHVNNDIQPEAQE